MEKREDREGINLREGIRDMNDRELLYLKFKRRFSTSTLLARFPSEKKRVMEVALLDVDNRKLRDLIESKKTWSRLKHLQRKFRQLRSKKEWGAAAPHSGLADRRTEAEGERE